MPEDLYACIEATWPAARFLDVPGWRVRAGAGGGNRVSSATATTPEADIAEMEAAQASLGQRPLVMVRPSDGSLDARLAEAGYAVRDPVTVYACPVGQLAEVPPPVSLFQVAWPPVHIQRELWAEGGIGPERLAVMDRVTGPHVALLGRSDDQPAGTAFVACHEGIAMLHALEVTPALSRQGTARHIMQGAELWGADQGAKWLAVLVTLENDRANALYASLGMEPVGQYHYRVK